jgi:hypothetical protein
MQLELLLLQALSQMYELSSGLAFMSLDVDSNRS